ncbi:MAG TPA: ECF-type sigma factor [Gemmatimonadaceae bacterium]|nr:ECF-type sigma factor [Gemmatimonadaceae bacterium]
MDSQGMATDEAVESGDYALTAPEQRTVDALFSATYEELRRLASTVRRADQNSTLSPTTLVNEAWLKLARSRGLTVMSELHFKRLAARAMRQVLVEAARRRNARRRGGEAMIVTFDDGAERTDAGADEILALDQALSDLAKLQPRQAMMVETRFFAGLDVAETARLLHVSEATVLRDWRAARAWLARELRAS